MQNGIQVLEMKFFETHFDEYVQAVDRFSLHSTQTKAFDMLPEKLANLQNMIFYGPKGVGKYSQALTCIKRYSHTDLKYEKRLSVSYNKEFFFIKISDIHFEVDMSLLGCNSKHIWNEIYNQIIDVVSARPDPHAIIVCKYFNRIHSELLDTFYSYMQNIESVKIRYILITDHISFIPDNILNHCQIFNFKRPTMAAYNKCLLASAPSAAAATSIKLTSKTQLSRITNIKSLKANVEQLMNPHEMICNKIVEILLSPDVELGFLTFRDLLYDLLIYDLDVQECVWYILEVLVSGGHIRPESFSDVMLRTYTFLKYYNNNYRPIYHLENYMFILISHIHGYKESAPSVGA